MFGRRRKPGRELFAIVAQLLVLVAIGLGLQFAVHTTGGTLFLFSTAGPLLVLTSIVIVAALGLARLRRRHSVFQARTFQAGEAVYREGDPADCVYFIEKGEVEVVRSHYGKDERIVRLGTGQYFGEMSLLSDRPNRSATVRAVAETQLSAVGKENFLRMIFAVPSVRDGILLTAHERFTSRPDASQT
jgi:CRP-like cAMP-binding protein